MGSCPMAGSELESGRFLPSVLLAASSFLGVGSISDSFSLSFLSRLPPGAPPH